MRLPGHLKLESITPCPGELEVTVWVRFRPQHLDMLRELWRVVRVKPCYLKPVVILLGWWRMCRGVRHGSTVEGHQACGVP
jgi:hypothetical protein